MGKSTIIKDIEYVFENRFSSKIEEWEKIREEFLETGIETLIDEDVSTLTFHVVYLKISKLTDKEVLEHMLDELK